MWLWSWFLDKCLLIFQYLLIQYKGIRFNYDGKYAIKHQTNRKTLFNILKKNKNTKFLIDQRQKVNFNKDQDIKSIEDFKKLFPKYTTYSDYRSYVTEIMNDGHSTNIMSIDYPIALTNTSGTSGDPKHFPVYFLDINEAYAISYMLTKTIPFNFFNGCKSISLNSLKYETHVTKDNLKKYKKSAITAIAAREKQNIETILKFNQNIVPPIILNEIAHQNDLFLLISIWSLQSKDLEFISSTFIMAIVHFFTFIEQKFDLICKHIELGTIPADESLSLPLSIDVRLALESTEYHLSPNPSRAQELRKIVDENGFHHVNTRFWPNLKCGICIISQSIRQFELKLLSTYWNPDIPIFPYVYGMSEHHRIAIPLKQNSYDLIPLPRSVYYEFIELKDDDDDDDDDDDKQPSESFELHQVEKDKYYEVLLTTYDGLYRYRTEDIIKITGHYYSLPTWQLIGRHGQYLSVAGEHITEIDLRDILNSILPEYEQEFTNSSPQYSIFLDKKSYVLAMEVDEDKEDNKDRLTQIGKELCTKLDQKLKESNEDYQIYRDKQKISSPILLWLKYNTLTTGIREFRLDPKYMGSHGSKIQISNQLKSQLIINSRSKKIIDFIKSNVVLKVN
ncbi:unnamed protein product [Rotaria sp. Silwood1]|nr:unnamed protein product [Rotaria sp. Silwood1]